MKIIEKYEAMLKLLQAGDFDQKLFYASKLPSDININMMMAYSETRKSGLEYLNFSSLPNKDDIPALVIEMVETGIEYFTVSQSNKDLLEDLYNLEKEGCKVVGFESKEVQPESQFSILTPRLMLRLATPSREANSYDSRKNHAKQKYSSIVEDFSKNPENNSKMMVVNMYHMYLDACDHMAGVGDLVIFNAVANELNEYEKTMDRIIERVTKKVYQGFQWVKA